MAVSASSRRTTTAPSSSLPPSPCTSAEAADGREGLPRARCAAAAAPGPRHTVPEPYEAGTTAPLEPGPPTISRRAMLATVGAAALGAGFMGFGQAVGGPFRETGPARPPWHPDRRRARTASRSTRPRPRSGSIPREAGAELAAGAGRWAHRGAPLARASCWRCPSTATTCRSPASKAGRRRSAGPVCACATSPPRSGSRRRARSLVESLQRGGALRKAVAQLRPGRRRAQPAGAAGERRDLSLDHGLPGAGDRPRRPRRPLHEVGLGDAVRGGLSRGPPALRSTAPRRCTCSPCSPASPSPATASCASSKPLARSARFSGSAPRSSPTT